MCKKAVHFYVRPRRPSKSIDPSPQTRWIFPLRISWTSLMLAQKCRTVKNFERQIFLTFIEKKFKKTRL